MLEQAQPSMKQKFILKYHSDPLKMKHENLLINIKIVCWDRYISEARKRDINMIGQPGEQQTIGLYHENETTITQGWHYGFTH